MSTPLRTFYVHLLKAANEHWTRNDNRNNQACYGKRLLRNHDIWIHETIHGEYLHLSQEYIYIYIYIFNTLQSNEHSALFPKWHHTWFGEHSRKGGTVLKKAWSIYKEAVCSLEGSQDPLESFVNNIPNSQPLHCRLFGLFTFIIVSGRKGRVKERLIRVNHSPYGAGSIAWHQIELFRASSREDGTKANIIMKRVCTLSHYYAANPAYCNWCNKAAEYIFTPYSLVMIRG